jgi:glycosyltransferase involved in cell wall biosynthesis
MPERFFIEALAARFGGTAYATVHLARQLAINDNVAQVSVLTRRGSIVARGLARAREVSCIELPVPTRFELARRAAWEAARLPALVRQERSSVVISMSGMLPRRLGARLLCMLFNPVMYEQASAANVLRRWAVRRTVRAEAEIVAPSRYMATLAAASIGRECSVVPLGVDHSVFHPDPNAARGAEILCVADFYSHKRHDIVLEAWLRLTPPRPLLRLVGNPAVDPGTYARVLTRVESLPGVVVEHGLSLAQLVGAYQQARAFIMASERESFCMPLLESMACGVPCVVRDVPSLRETGGGGASYVAGDDPDAWAAALERATDDGASHERARQAAVASAARFSWERMAAEVAALF